MFEQNLIQTRTVFLQTLDITRRTKGLLNNSRFSCDYNVLCGLHGPKSMLKGSFFAVMGTIGLIMAAEAVRELQKRRAKGEAQEESICTNRDTKRNLLQ